MDKLTAIKKLPKGQLDVNVILNWVYGVIGLVAVAMIIIGAIQYVTSQGSADKAKKAKNTILYAVIGLVIVLLAAAITSFVFTSVEKAR